MSVALGSAALAQDSVSLNGCLPGDAVSPWADAAATFGSEQRNNYVLDLVSFKTSWGNTFALGPISKTSQSNPAFFNSLMEGQGISARQLNNRGTSQTFGVWNTAGAGVNNDDLINDPVNTVGGPIDANQFATMYGEFGGTGVFAGGTDQYFYAGVVTNVVHYDPTRSTRLYVQRINSALNGCDNANELSTFGTGAVLYTGHTVFRADTNGINGGPCGISITGNNAYIIDALARDDNILNVMDGAGALHDGPATKWVIVNDPTTYGCPNIAEILGVPFYIGTDAFVGPPPNYVRGSAAPLTASSAHLAVPANDHRGLLSRLDKNHPAFASTQGLAAILQKDADALGPFTTVLNVWGLDNLANPTVKMALPLPALVTDPVMGVTNVPGPIGAPNELSNYESQVLFSGGNGQVAMNIDKKGNLLVAATADHPSHPSRDYGFHYLPVARITPAGVVTWSMAAYNLSSGGPVGKPILNGPGGAPIGFLSNTLSLTVGVRSGPSMSSPMIDSTGNIWFVSVVDTTISGGGLSVGLVRAVYDEVRFGWELELVAQQGDVFTGANSTIDYQIDFIDLFDSNSIHSAAPFSNSISLGGHNGQYFPSVPNSDPLHLGGLTLSAVLTYDVDQNGLFDFDCVTNGTLDEQYNVQLFVGSDRDCQLNLGKENQPFITTSMCGDGLAAGDVSTWRLAGAEPNAPCTLFISLAGFADFTLFPLSASPLTLCSIGGFFLQVPLAVDANGEVSVPIPGSAPLGVDLVWQAILKDTRVLPHQLAGSNCLLVKFGQ